MALPAAAAAAAARIKAFCEALRASLTERVLPPAPAEGEAAAAVSDGC